MPPLRQPTIGKYKYTMTTTIICDKGSGKFSTWTTDNCYTRVAKDIVPVTKILVSSTGSANTLCKVPSSYSNFNCCGILKRVMKPRWCS